MAIDYDRKQLAEAEKLKAAFEKDPDGFLAATEDLTASDFELIGRMIQQFCFADFCARRIIDTIYDAAMGPENRIASTLHDADVLENLRLAAGLLGPGNVKDTILRAADILEMHRKHRHDFAHWAMRRVSRANALIFFSKNTKEAKKRDGVPLDAYAIKFGVLPMDGLPREIEKLDQHVHNLSVLAPDLELRIEEIRAGFDRAKQGIAPDAK